jgi:Fe2+ or Zn2+ uptake regulation protein
LAAKLTYSDGSARYDARMDLHHHARCLSCGRVMDVPADRMMEEIERLSRGLDGFSVLGYRLELTGFCGACSPYQRTHTSTGPMN